jgi:hypothetical protein
VRQLRDAKIKLLVETFNGDVLCFWRMTLPLADCATGRGRQPRKPARGVAAGQLELNPTFALQSNIGLEV